VKLPRDVSGEDLAHRLARLGYAVTRQTGSHLRLTRRAGSDEHHLTIPRHSSLRIGTLANILRDVAEQVEMSRDELLEKLFGAGR
jgi:predicted RNA binding protein YcfA (HicA-like mRNA interferase family)